MSNQRRYLSLDGFRDIVRGVTDPKAVDATNLCLVSQMPTEVKAIGSDDSRMIEFIITTDRVDREQDTVNVNGWEVSDYVRNPVVLWCHDHYSLPVANSKSLSFDGNKLKSITEFTPADLNPFGYMTYRLYAKGFLHAVSVGFLPLEYTYAEDRKYGVNYVRQSLLEYSCVPVPANPDALAVARSKGGIDLGPMKAWAEQLLDDQNLTGDARRQTEILRAVSAPTGRALILQMGGSKMAGNSTPVIETPAIAPSKVKRVERWDCGIEGHTHALESEAKECSEFDGHVTDVTRSLQGLASHIKSGKTLKPEAAALLRSVVSDVAPLPTPREEGKKTLPATPVVETEDGVFIIDEAQLRSAILDGVNENFLKATGRVV